MTGRLVATAGARARRLASQLVEEISHAGDDAGLRFFTWPRKTTVGRMRTSRTRRIVSGLGSGGGAGELASKLSGGMMTVYTGS
jgi:hypothetical protein